MSLILKKDSIVCPRLSTGGTLTVNLADIAQVEARIPEVARVTPQKAPELLATLNMAWRDISDLVVVLRHEHNLAKSNHKKVRSRILLDVVPGIIRERDLSDSKDMREAILDGNEEVQTAQQMEYELACVVELLQGKKQSIEMAYSSVKKLLGEGAFNFLGNTPDTLLSAGGTEAAGIGMGGTSSTTPRLSERPAGFGKPRY